MAVSADTSTDALQNTVTEFKRNSLQLITTIEASSRALPSFHLRASYAPMIS
jgi:hypothetical protein